MSGPNKEAVRVTLAHVYQAGHMTGWCGKEKPYGSGLTVGQFNKEQKDFLVAEGMSRFKAAVAVEAHSIKGRREGRRLYKEQKRAGLF